MKKKLSIVSILTFAITGASAQNSLPPEPYGSVPSERQMRWHELERYCFLHFTTNTFTEKEWGFGDCKSLITIDIDR